jgi:hypothetical protein
VSAQTQLSLAALLDDTAWLDAFMAEKNARLRAAHAAVSASLTAAGVPHAPACAGMFVWLDLRCALKDGGKGATAADERALWSELFEGDARLLLTPGADCAAPAPGFFRAVRCSPLRCAARARWMTVGRDDAIFLTSVCVVRLHACSAMRRVTRRRCRTWRRGCRACWRRGARAGSDRLHDASTCVAVAALQIGDVRLAAAGASPPRRRSTAIYWLACWLAPALSWTARVVAAVLVA